MRTVGVRELRQRVSEFLRLVEAGESFEVTDRGRPVALLVPLPDRGPLSQLRASGDIAGPDGDFDDLPEALELPSGAEPPSAVLARLRADQR